MEENRTCLQCGKMFPYRKDVWSDAHGRGKYCCTECYNKSKGDPPVLITCLCGCGRKRYVQASRVKEGNGKFFSKECRSKYHREHRPWVTCAFPGCNNKFQIMPFEISRKLRTMCEEHRFYNPTKFKPGKQHRMWVEKIPCTCEQCGIEFEMLPKEISRGRGRFHNKDCKLKWMHNRFQGENHANYNPNRQPRYIGFTPSAKRRCREFWHNTCFITGVSESKNINTLGKQEDLTCHHIDGDKESLFIIPILRAEHNKIEGIVKKNGGKPEKIAEDLLMNLLYRLKDRGYTLQQYVEFLGTGE